MFWFQNPVKSREWTKSEEKQFKDLKKKKKKIARWQIQLESSTGVPHLQKTAQKSPSYIWTYFCQFFYPTNYSSFTENRGFSVTCGSSPTIPSLQQVIEIFPSHMCFVCKYTYMCPYSARHSNVRMERKSTSGSQGYIIEWTLLSIYACIYPLHSQVQKKQNEKEKFL